MSLRLSTMFAVVLLALAASSCVVATPPPPPHMPGPAFQYPPMFFVHSFAVDGSNVTTDMFVDAKGSRSREDSINWMDPNPTRSSAMFFCEGPQLLAYTLKFQNVRMDPQSVASCSFVKVPPTTDGCARQWHGAATQTGVVARMAINGINPQASCSCRSDDDDSNCACVLAHGVAGCGIDLYDWVVQPAFAGPNTFLPRKYHESVATGAAGDCKTVRQEVMFSPQEGRALGPQDMQDAVQGFIAQLGSMCKQS